jgi:polyphosphate kinase
MPKHPLKAPHLYINRELSWLEFNDRVLQEGLSEDLPLMERVKFLAIVASNLDEFFLVRVAGLMRQRAAKSRHRDPSGMTASEQLAAVGRRARRMMAEHAQGVRDALGALASRGLRVLDIPDLSALEQQYLQSHFAKEILPVLTPLAIQDLSPPPLLPGMQLHVAAVITVGEPDQRREKIVVVPVPTQLKRFVSLPSEQGVRLVRAEDVIAARLGELFHGCEVNAAASFRITRDADIRVEDDAGDMLDTLEEAVLDRRRRAAVRLMISKGADPRIVGWLTQWLRLRPEEVYELDGVQDAAALWELAGLPCFDELKIDDWPPQQPRDLIGAEDLWQTIEDHDVMLFHPYESFDPVVQLLEQAANDPEVLAIKQTLYRTSGDSPIVRALQQAAEKGKEVTVLVELRARFDEARNVNWARRLENAGCHVIYGIAGLKTHAKALLIVRRQAHRIRRYAHLSTGNYNDRTAKLYSDIGLMTCNADIASDVAAFFNLLTGYSESVGWSQLTIAPSGLKRRFLDLIDREIETSSPERPGSIMAKTNSLQDPDICRALYRASQAGVKIALNVRGICCLRPGVQGASETIEVRSIVDRFLEHARIYCFRNGGHEEVYLSSADWMRRNLKRRMEILFPVLNPILRRRLMDILHTYFSDNVKARVLGSDGVYKPVSRDGPKLRAQEKFYRDILGEVRSAETTATQFQPLTRPKD